MQAKRFLVFFRFSPWYDFQWNDQDIHSGYPAGDARLLWGFPPTGLTRR